MVFGFDSVPPTVTVNFVGGKCPLCFIMFGIDSKTTFVKVTKIVTSEKVILVTLFLSCQVLGEDQGVRYLVSKDF